MNKKLSIKTVVFSLAIMIALWLALFPLASYPSSYSHSAALIIVTLVGWSSGVMPLFLIALFFFAIAAIFKLLPASLLFAGFGSTAVWLVVSGFVIGSAISTCGLGQRLASLIAPHIVGSYPRLIFGLIFSAMFLGFIMPSSVGRAVVLLPIGMALADQVGFAKGSHGRLGIATALTISCNMPSFAILPANIPNMILIGASETLYHVHFRYAEYLLLHFPILGVVKSLLTGLLVLLIFPAKPGSQISDSNPEIAPPTLDAAVQIKVGILLAITLLFWTTDTIHGISPAWIGLATAAILLLPKWGVLAPKTFNSSVDFATIVFVAAALGLGTLVNESGIGATMGHFFTQLLPNAPGHDFFSFMILTIISTVTGLVATVPSVPTVLTPMAANFADATGLSITAVLMTQVVGFSTVLFPYQVAPLIIAMQLSKEPLSKLLKITLPLAAMTILVLMPLDYLWWHLLGWLD